MQRYLSILPKLNNVIEKQKIANVIIINEMSTMINNIFCIVEQRLKQAMFVVETSPFETKLVLLVGDLAQLPLICKHMLRQNDILCKSCDVNFTFLSISMCHATNFGYIQFFNIIQKRKPTTKEFKKFYHHVFANSTNRFSHQ
jgi:hypothetical protein